MTDDRKPCGFCGAVRSVLPNQVAAYLLDLELKRQAAKKQEAARRAKVTVNYSVKIGG